MICGLFQYESPQHIVKAAGGRGTQVLMRGCAAEEWARRAAVCRAAKHLTEDDWGPPAVAALRRAQSQAQETHPVFP